jgi:hypothetical protein
MPIHLLHIFPDFFVNFSGSKRWIENVTTLEHIRVQGSILQVTHCTNKRLVQNEKHKQHASSHGIH